MSTDPLPEARQSGKSERALEEWSSFVGIVTAIVGNILISFALNIQRYAHIRLERDQNEQKHHWKGRHKRGHTRSYGTQQDEYAEERARLNRTAPAQNDGEQINGDVPSKLIQPQSSAASFHSESSSHSTIKPSEKTERQPTRKTYLKSPYWWAGIVLMTVGEAGNFLAYGFASASIVSPLGVVALVSNCIIAPCLLKERFRQRDFWGLMTAIAGAVVVVLSAKTSEGKMGPHDVWVAITRWEFETYLGITIGLMILLMWASGKYGSKTILIDLGLVGLFGGYTALSTKGVASLLSDTLWRALTFPITYLLVLVLIVTALMQIRYVNRALQRFDSTQVIPTQFVLFTLSVIIGSAVLYRDFETATGDRIGKFIGGCLLTFLGVYLITSQRSRQRSEEGGPDLDDEENAIGLVDEEGYQEDADTRADQYERTKSSMDLKFEEREPIRTSRRSSKQTDFSSSTEPFSTSSRTSSTAGNGLSPSPSSNLYRPYSYHPSSSPQRPQAPESSASSPLLPSEVTNTPAVTTPTTTVTPRPPTLTRRSMARLTPGPVMSPLSPSLSALFADDRRRNATKSTSSPHRPKLSGLRESKSRSSREGEASSSEETLTRKASLTLLKGGAETHQPTQGDEVTRAGRSRSIRDAFGIYWKKSGNGGKGKDSEQDGD